MSNSVLAVAVALAAVAIICILVSTVAVLLLRRAVDARALHAAIYSSDASSDVGQAFPIGPGVFKSIVQCWVYNKCYVLVHTFRTCVLHPQRR